MLINVQTTSRLAYWLLGIKFLICFKIFEGNLSQPSPVICHIFLLYWSILLADKYDLLSLYHEALEKKDK